MISRRQFIKRGALYVPALVFIPRRLSALSNGVSNQNVGRIAVLNAGGGGGSYVVLLDPSLGTTSFQISADTLVWMPLSGITTVSKVGIYCDSLSAPALINLGLFNSGGALLHNEPLLCSVTGWTDATISPVSGAAYIAFLGDLSSSNFATVPRESTSGTSHYNTPISPIGVMPSMLPSDLGPITSLFSLRVFTP